MNDNAFDIIDYLSGLTGFVFDKAVLKRIAIDCGVIDVTYYSELTEENKDMCRIALYETILVTPHNTASSTRQHGAYTNTIGQQTITAAVIDNVKDMLRQLYTKYDMQDKLDSLGGDLCWIDENEYGY